MGGMDRMDNIQRGRTTIAGPSAQSGSLRLLDLREQSEESEARRSYGSVHVTPRNTVNTDP